MNSDLTAVASSIHISKLTFNRIRLNLFFAFLYNALGIPIAAGVFFPWWQTAMPPWMAGLAMVRL